MTRSRPDLDDDEPDTGVTRLAMNGDVIALKIKHVEERHREAQMQNHTRFVAIEQHFHPDSGMVTKMAKTVDSARVWVASIPVTLVVLSIIAGVIFYMIHASEREQDLQLLQKAASVKGTP